MKALNETTYSIQHLGDTELTWGTGTNAVVTASNVTLDKNTNWFNLNWNYKKQLRVKNNSTGTVHSGSPITINLDSSSLESVLANCNDIRVTYQAVNELPVTVKAESNNCQTSKNTQLTFPLRADIATGVEDITNYALFYGNSGASAPLSQAGYSFEGSANASMVCSLNGTTTCETGQTPSSTTGPIRYTSKGALNFDGKNTYINAGNIDPLTYSAFSISVWMKSPDFSYDNSAFRAIVHRFNDANNNFMVLNWGNQIDFMVMKNGTQYLTESTANIANGSWYYLTFVFDGSSSKVYINGVNDSHTSAIYRNGTDNFLSIGRRSAGFGHYSGLLDDFILYDKALSSSEITSIYSGGTGRAITPDLNTKLLYHFDENGDDPRNTGKIIDASGNGNNVSLIGAQYGDGIVPASTYSSHQGVTLEENTTNLVPNPSFESDITTGWSGKNAVNFTTSQTDADGNQLVGSNNIKDVFYYDTTKDSDGGAWRNNANAQSKSWYTEAFSTTRGKKKEFPEKAYIVATDVGVDIIDAVENKLWMRFIPDSNSSRNMLTCYNTTNSVFAINGQINATSNQGNGVCGIRTANFINDNGYRYRVSGTGRSTYQGTISQRNSILDWGSNDTAKAILSGDVNDSSSLVISGKSYIAVSTDLGVSVINETDGTIANFTAASYTASGSVWLTSSRMYFVAGSTSAGGQLYYINIPSTDWTSGKSNMGLDDPAYVLLDVPGYGGNTNGPLLSQQIKKIGNVTIGTSTVDGTSNTLYLSNISSSGLTVLNEKRGDDTRGSLKYYDKDHITEELVGATKGQWGFWQDTNTDANIFKPSGYLDTGKMSQAVSMYGNSGGTLGSTLSFDRGLQISGNNYERINSNQGTISLWFKPNWSGNPSTVRYLYRSVTGNPVDLYISTAGTLTSVYWDGTGGRTSSIAGTSWSSSNWYHIVTRWNINNPVSGTQYVDVLLNNVDSSNGYTSPITIGATGTGKANYIGSHSDGSKQAQGLIDDFVIYDRPLSSSEVGNIYNSGSANEAGYVADSSLKFYAKMDGTGTLNPVTYNGGSSASKLTRKSTELTGGVNLLANAGFENATGGLATSWSLSSNSTATDAETVNIFADTRSQKVQYPADCSVGQELQQYVTLTGGSNYTLSFWYMSNNAAQVYPRIYNTTTPGDLIPLVMSKLTSATWVRYEQAFKVTGSGNQTVSIAFRKSVTNDGVISTVYYDNMSLVQNLVDNGGMEVAGAGGADIWSGWTESTSGSSTLSDDTGTVHSGSHSAKIVVDGSNSAVSINQSFSTTVGNSYLLSFWVNGTAGKSMAVDIGGYSTNNATTFTGSWQKVSYVFLGSGSQGVVIKRWVASTTFYIDDISVTPLDNVSLSFKSWSPISDSTAYANSLSIQGTLTGVQSLASGVRNSGLTFDGTGGYLRQQTIATNLGTLSYSVGNDTTTATFEDDGMDFNTYATAAGNSPYMIVVTNSDNTTSWGYLGVASGTGNKDIQIYTTKARATRGWGANGSILPINGSKVPVGYEIMKTDYQFSGSFSYNFWIKDVDWANSWIVNKGSSVNSSSDFGIYRTYGDNLYHTRLQTSGGNYVLNFPGPQNTWSCISIVYDSVNNTFSVYENGTLQSSLPTSGTPNNNYYGLRIGADYYTPWNYGAMKGSIDEFTVTAEALSSSQVLDMYNKGLGALNHATKTDQKLQGGSGTVQTVYGSSDGTTIYAGTDTAMSIIKQGKVGNYTDSDSTVTTLNTSSTPALLSNNSVAMDVVGSSLTTPTIIVGSSASGVTALNTDRLTKTKNTSLPGFKYGSASLKLDNSLSSLDSVYSTPLTLTASSYTISAYAYSDGTALTSSDISLYANSQPLSTTYTDSGGGWYRLTGTFTAVASQLNFGVQVRPGKIIYVDGVQVENKANVTTYADGTLGTGYAWTGTANNSSSTRTYGSISYPWTGTNTGSASFWFKPINWGGTLCLPAEGDIVKFGSNKLIYVDANNCTIIHLYETGIVQRASFTINSSNLVAGRWNNLVVNFSPSSTQLFLNGVAGSASTGLSSSDSGSSILLAIGSNIYKPNSVYSDLRMFNQPLTTNQVSDIYLSGLVNHKIDSGVQTKYATTGTWESPVMNFSSNASWGSVPNFIPNETLNGNSINYEVKTSPDGVSWNAYTTNTGSTPNYSISQVANKYVQVKATLNSVDQTTTPTLTGIGINYVKDTTPPTTNASNIIMSRSLSGNQILPSTWTNNIAPSFTWDQGADNVGGSSLRGYCLSLSQQSDVDPINSKGNLLGTSPVTTGGSNCQFIIGTNSIDFAELAYRGLSWLTTSNNLYYLRIRAVDNTGNVYNAGSYAEFSFYFDDIAPTNVTSISAPGNSFANVNDIYFNWPTSGASSASDANSNILGYQYSINNENAWLGTDTDSLLGIQYLPKTTVVPYYLTSIKDGTYIQTGNNTIYFRAVDVAGNVSIINRTANVSYGGNAPTFADGSKVTITPATSSSNSFGISWPEAQVNSPRTVKSYYYMVNVTPPSNLATITGNSLIYIPTTNTTVPTGMINGLVKGSNTIYVVSVDDLDNYSQSNFISGTVTLNSNLPDPVVNLSVSDSSIKAAKVWRASLAWEVPEYKGTGDLTYKIQRSEDNITWADVSETTGLSYVDTVPTSKKYYWRIGTTDSTDASKSNPTYSLTVSILPKGSYLAPAELTSGPTLEKATTKRATIGWTTDRKSDSKIVFGVETGKYFTEEISNSIQESDHTINLINLLPSTTYYYKAKWTDEDGNTGQSDERTFVTDSAPEVKNVLVKYVSIDSAQIDFTSVKAEKVKIYYGKSTSFGGVKELATSLRETSYTIGLDSLEDGVKYYYRVNPVDSEGIEYEGTILDFKTLPKPSVSNIKIQQVKNTVDTTIVVSWLSNTEISSIISYYPESNSNQVMDKVNLSLVKDEHKLSLTGLIPDKSYILVVKGRDKIGNEALSEKIKFTTATDTRAPVISDMIVETVPNGSNDSSDKKSQVVISWNTDEPATSEVQYGEGYSEIYPMKSITDYNLTYNHMISISGLEPSKVYHFKAVSKDKAENIGNSNNVVSITLKANSNSTDLILGSLRNLFNF
ncbi:MAG: LamG-like jellyroll fold domain-containing protein [bacterium]